MTSAHNIRRVTSDHEQLHDSLDPVVHIPCPAPERRFHLPRCFDHEKVFPKHNTVPLSCVRSSGWMWVKRKCSPTTPDIAEHRYTKANMSTNKTHSCHDNHLQSKTNHLRLALSSGAPQFSVGGNDARLKSFSVVVNEIASETPAVFKCMCRRSLQTATSTIGG